MDYMKMITVDEAIAELDKGNQVVIKLSNSGKDSAALAVDILRTDNNEYFIANFNTTDTDIGIYTLINVENVMACYIREGDDEDDI